jgi:UTP-glucose-1-phosphate uridylyltransferase
MAFNTKHQKQNSNSTRSSSSSNLVIPRSSKYTHNHSHYHQLQPYPSPKPNNNLQITDSLIRMIQHRDTRIKEQDSQTVDLVHELAAAEKIQEMRQWDKDYIEKVRLWRTLSENERGFERLKGEV